MGQDWVGSAQPYTGDPITGWKLLPQSPLPGLAASHFYQKSRWLDISRGDHSREQKAKENSILKMIIN
jgi:hypothetical protein